MDLHEMPICVTVTILRQDEIAVVWGWLKHVETANQIKIALIGFKSHFEAKMLKESDLTGDLHIGL
jgi:hypothetical protein